MYSHKEIHERSILRSAWHELHTNVAILVLQVLHDHKGLKNTAAVFKDDGRYFPEGIDLGKLFRLEVSVSNHFDLDLVLETLESDKQSHSSCVVRVDHVKKF